MLDAMRRADRPLIYFTDYGELREGKPVLDNGLLKVKRLMLTPPEGQGFSGQPLGPAQGALHGLPHLLPSVSFARENLPEVIFEHGYRSCEDWQAWEKLSRLQGLSL